VRNCNKEKNLTVCNCSYEPCSRKGICCDCLTYHRSMDELPACYFPKDVERTYNRSIDNFIRTYQSRRR
jgi:hypothetical protein